MEAKEKIKTLEEMELPSSIESVEALEHLLSTPTRGLVEDFSSLDGDIMILGVGGKVGPTLAMMAKRAAPNKKVIGVARFSDLSVKERLEQAGVETITCDLLDREAVNALPTVKNIVYMAGKKFGTEGQEPFTWAMNAVVPAWVGACFNEDTRFVAFSTLCVYPFADVHGLGSHENEPIKPVGEYPNSCVARERVFQYFSNIKQAKGHLARLNYAIDLRYGVIHDIALKVRAGEPIDIRTGYANVIWQGESTADILRCLKHGETPASPINIGAEKSASVRYIADTLGKHFGKAPQYVGEETSTAWHNDTTLSRGLFGATQVDLDTMIQWNVDWLERDMPLHHLPTHYEEREGVF